MQALSAFMLFCRDHREIVAGELGTSAPNVISKALGERWAAQEDRSKWDREAAAERERHDGEMAEYDAQLMQEEDEEQRARQSAAAGPSDRDAERAEKRAMMQEQASQRIEAPKQPKRQKVLTEEEKTLAAQNKEIMGDMQKSAKQRLTFLLGQSDLFKHFGLQADDEKQKSKKRKSEKEEDEEMAASLEGGAGGDAFEEKLRVTKQPTIINSEHGNMRPYQVLGLNWLANLYQNGINGILADEMGLGKTLQCISLLCWLRETKDLPRPYLVLAPKSTLRNWVREFANWAPDFKVLHFHGDKDERQRIIDEEMRPDMFDVCITSYEMVIREQNAFRKFSWRYLIVDEAHRLKNEESKLAQVLRSFSSHSRLLITGTPLQNNLHELWALLNFLLPDVFHSADQFDEWFDLKDKQVEQEVISQLHKLLRPFLLRRVKTEVEGSIPPKQVRRLGCTYGLHLPDGTEPPASRARLPRWLSDLKIEGAPPSPPHPHPHPIHIPTPSTSPPRPHPAPLPNPIPVNPSPDPLHPPPPPPALNSIPHQPHLPQTRPRPTQAHSRQSPRLSFHLLPPSLPPPALPLPFPLRAPRSSTSPQPHSTPLPAPTSPRPHPNAGTHRLHSAERDAA